MTLPELLSDLGRAGVTLRAAEGGIGFTPRSALTSGRAAALADHKAAILAIIENDDDPLRDGDEYVIGERLGMAEGLGLSVCPGAPAWLVAIGEAMGAAPPTPVRACAGFADRLAGIVAAVLAAPVRASTLPPGERFPGEPEWDSPEISTKRRK